MNKYTICNCCLLASVSVLLLSSCAPIPSEEKTPQTIIQSELLRKNGNALIASDNFPEAVKVFDQLIELDSENALAYNGKAVAFDHSGNHLAAQDIYKTALSLSPDSLPIKNNLAMSLILNKQPKQAIELLEPLTLNNNDKSSNSNIVRHNLALAYGILGQYKEATKLNLRDMTEKQAQENIRFYEKYTLHNTSTLDKNKKGKNKKNKILPQEHNEHNIGFITPPAPLPPSPETTQTEPPTKPPTAPKTESEAKSEIKLETVPEVKSEDKLKSAPKIIQKISDNSDEFNDDPTFIGLSIIYEYPE